MDPNRGIRMTEDRLLSDGTPNPGDVVEWAAGLQSDMKTGGSLLITKEVAKYIQGLKKGYCKFYAKHFNILSNQQEYTVAVYRYMMSLGLMEKGDYLCINQGRHDQFKQFDTEEEMRAHWLECHQIQLEEIFLMMLVPDPCKEPANVPHLNLPGVSGTQVVLPGISPVLQNMQPLVPQTRTQIEKEVKGDPPSSLSKLATVPPVESTATEKTDILELTTEEQEVDATGESVDTGEKASLSDID